MVVADMILGRNSAFALIDEARTRGSRVPVMSRSTTTSIFTVVRRPGRLGQRRREPYVGAMTRAH